MQLEAGGGGTPNSVTPAILTTPKGTSAPHSTDQPSSLPSLQCPPPLTHPPLFILHFILLLLLYLQQPRDFCTKSTFAMYPFLRFSFLYTLFFTFTGIAVTHSVRHLHEHLQDNPNNCTVKCGSVQIPFPFHLTNTSCTPSISDSFSLSCVNSSSLFLNIASESYRVLHFFSDGVLVDFPNTTICRQYNDLRSFSFSGNQYYGISSDNVLDLYDCEDSYLCEPDCEKISLMPNCDLQAGSYPSCCYPLSDRSAHAWRPSEGFSVFSQFGCRGFSSWVVLPGSRTGKRGVKLDWAVPGNLTGPVCAANAEVVNVSSVLSGIRCQCRDGFFGDGFAAGVGCLKSCFKNGKEVHGDDCYPKNHGRRKATLLAGVIALVFTAVSLMALFCFLKRRPIKTDKYVTDQSCCPSSILPHKTGRPRLFTYHELEEATKGFDEGRKIVDGTTKMYGAILTYGSHVAVQRLHCENERDLIVILYRVEALSTIFHKNMARIVGWSVDSGCTPLVVYEYPENGTFEEHLRRARYQQVPFDWFKRLNVVAEIASFLAFLANKNLPPIFHNDLRSGCVFLDADFSVKLAGFEMLNVVDFDQESCQSSESSHCRKNDVCALGVVLLEIITGNTAANFSTSALQKIENGKLEEIVDPSLYYHEQPSFRKEQIEIIADLATRCLLFGADGKLSMADVAKELVHVTKESVDGSSRRGPGLEETFSNSSLLQMISMSPDSIYVP